MTTLTKNCTESEGWKTFDRQQKMGCRLLLHIVYPSFDIDLMKSLQSVPISDENFALILCMYCICSDPDIADWHHYCHLNVNKFTTVLTLLCYPTFQFQQELEAFALGQKKWEFFMTFAIRRRKSRENFHLPYPEPSDMIINKMMAIPLQLCHF